MACNLADKPALLVEIHPLKVGFVACENFIGLGDDPNLYNNKLQNSQPAKIGVVKKEFVHASELSSSIVGRGRYWTGFLLNNTCSTMLFSVRRFREST